MIWNGGKIKITWEGKGLEGVLCFFCCCFVYIMVYLVGAFRVDVGIFRVFLDLCTATRGRQARDITPDALHTLLLENFLIVCCLS